MLVTLISCVIEGEDFSLDTTEVTFVMNSANDITMEVMVTPVDDMLVECTESYILSIAVSSGPACMGAMDTIVINIEDNDGKSELIPSNI